MRRVAIGILLLAAAAACNPTVDGGIFNIGGGGGGGGGSGAATHLVFTTQPQSAQATAAMANPIVVAAQNVVGQVDTTYSGLVTLTLSSNPDSAILTGNISVSAINGVATFTNVAVSKADTGYVLTAASGALTVAVSVKFTITP